MSATYKNPRHKPSHPMYGPAEYSTDAKPDTYKGYLIYNRIRAHNGSGSGCWDVVKDGVCVTQRAGPNGAKSAIDQLCEQTA